MSTVGHHGLISFSLSHLIMLITLYLSLSQTTMVNLDLKRPIDSNKLTKKIQIYWYSDWSLNSWELWREREGMHDSKSLSNISHWWQSWSLCFQQWKWKCHHYKTQCLELEQSSNQLNQKPIFLSFSHFVYFMIWI